MRPSDNLTEKWTVCIGWRETIDLLTFFAIIENNGESDKGNVLPKMRVHAVQEMDESTILRGAL